MTRRLAALPHTPTVPPLEPGAEVLHDGPPRVLTETDALPPLLVRVERAMDLLGVSRSMLYRLIGSGELPIVKLYRRTLIPYVEVVALSQRLRGGA